jgi:hypothetical protein
MSYPSTTPHIYDTQEKFEDIKEVIRICKYKKSLKISKPTSGAGTGYPSRAPEFTLGL